MHKIEVPEQVVLSARRSRANGLPEAQTCGGYATVQPGSGEKRFLELTSGSRGEEWVERINGMLESAGRPILTVHPASANVGFPGDSPR